MTADLTLAEARADRDALATRVDVLDKVKALTLLPRSTYVTTEMVAAYYEVDFEAIKKVGQRHRDELESDGLTVLTGEVLRDIKSLCGIEARVNALTVFPVRAVLRVGMLLRDSVVARRVRDHLLNVEQVSALTPNPAELTRKQLALMVVAGLPGPRVPRMTQRAT